jgi:acyl dehydratase
MPVDLSAVGFETEPSVLEYDWSTVVTYALAIGAKRDELDFLLHGRGPKVYPSFPLVAAYVPLSVCFGRAGGNFAFEVQGGQSLRVHRPVPPEGRIVTRVRIEAIYDRGKFAQIVLRSLHTIGGELCVEGDWSTIWRADGGFGGPGAPARDTVAAPRDRAPDFVFADPSSPEQALFYSALGDFNPVHGDPEWARNAGFPAGPILHGLCTFGFVLRAVVQRGCAGDPRRLRALDAEFRKNVWPGDVIETRGWRVDGGRVALEAFAGGRPDPVVTNAWAELAD